MAGTSLVAEDLDEATAAAVLELVNRSDDLAASLDNPDLAAALQAGDYGSIADIEAAAANADALGELVVAATAGAPLSRLQRRADLANRQVGLDVVLFDPARDRIHMLNATGGALWWHITPDRSLRAIIDAVFMTFGSTAGDSVAGDVVGFIAALRAEGLLLAEGESAPDPSGNHPESFEIPDGEISTLDNGYIPPGIKSFDLAELDDVLGEVSGFISKTFADVWLFPSPDSWASQPQFQFSSPFTQISSFGR